MLDALPALKASKYNLFGAGEQAGFDVFRFKDGVIVEHLDNNLDAVAKANPSGHTEFDGITEVKNLNKTEENKLLVSNVVRDVLGCQDSRS